MATTMKTAMKMEKAVTFNGSVTIDGTLIQTFNASIVNKETEPVIQAYTQNAELYRQYRSECNAHKIEFEDEVYAEFDTMQTPVAE